jgi:hypothetical protein
VKAIVITLLVLAACGGHDQIDDYVGAACVRDSDCADRCYTGGAFPAGFCSIPCRDDLDCPSDTVCTDREGGVCMFLCSELDCGRLGPGWKCKDRDNRAGGKDNVCIGD